MNRLLAFTIAAPLVLAAAASFAAPAPANRALWDYKKELGLSSAQAASMKAVVARLSADLKAANDKQAALNAQAGALIARSAPIPEIRAKLEELASVNTESRIADIEASRKILGMMTPAQSEKWRAIQARTQVQR